MRSTSLRTVLGWLVRLELCTLQRPLGRKILAGSLFGSAIVCAVMFVGPRLAAGFITAPHYPAGPGPTAVAVGDFNGDGIPDLAIANYGTTPNHTDGGVTILLGKGDGTFQPPENYSIGAAAGFLAVGDFNSDGKLDLVTANGNGKISVLLGNGDGTFQAPQSFSAGPFSLGSVSVSDFNGDGHPDLALVNFDQSVSVLLGNGDGTFQTPYNYPGYGPPIAIGDFNRDGSLDIAANSDLGTAVLLGNGDGTFRAVPGCPVGLGFSVAVGDFNGDGYPDLAVGNRGGVTILLNAADWP